MIEKNDEQVIIGLKDEFNQNKKHIDQRRSLGTLIKGLFYQLVLVTPVRCLLLRVCSCVSLCVTVCYCVFVCNMSRVLDTLWTLECYGVYNIQCCVL